MTNSAVLTDIKLPLDPYVMAFNAVVVWGLTFYLGWSRRFLKIALLEDCTTPASSFRLLQHGLFCRPANRHLHVRA